MTLKAINITGLTLKPEELEILKRLGLEVKIDKKPKSPPCNPKVVKPYTLEVKVTCLLCGEKFSLYYKMESLTKFCLKSKTVEKPEGEVNKTETRKWKCCENCAVNLAKLEKEELVKKLIWCNRGL